METTKYDSVPVAKYLLALATEKGKNLNATQLQKLLFIAYGFILTKIGEPILKEGPRAWPYGPVFPRVQKHVNLGFVYKLEDSEFEDLKKDKLLTEILNKVIDNYSVHSASKLSAWSHKEGSPWDVTVKSGGIKSQEIPDSLIMDYFKRFDI
jgi:uncharacterized phage-associated protein